MDSNLLFALDIGTRSVVGLVGEKTGDIIKVVSLERHEHNTRAMLDGQIHDVPEVAQVLALVKSKLSDRVGPLKKVAVAAAGRALCTVTAGAEIDCSSRGALLAEDERALELAAIQTAQHKLATGNTVDDPASYYCVGYSVIKFALDATPLKTLVGQKGKTASIELIATFLPRQVIDSLQTAVEQVGLEISTLTLEPIAAINVLIPPTMRHLNLALVDVGAGTSDVAITRDGTVNGYGMVPFAGDEITEALSHQYLLDFKVAEALKRELGDGINKEVGFSDVLGCSYTLASEIIIQQLLPSVKELAKAIAAQIMALNNAPPQAVLLVGGGSLTPCLPEELAQALEILPNRVGIRRPDSVAGIENVPEALCAPDGVTPLGILKLAGSKTLNFVNVTLNGQALRLFNLGKLSVADALLVAGLDVRSLHGRPGLGITVICNAEKIFVPGTLGHSGYIEVNGATASLSDILSEGDSILLERGRNGQSPTPMVKEVMTIPPSYTIMINEELFTIGPIITVNGLPATPETVLADRDKVVCHPPTSLAEALSLAGIKAEPQENRYLINGAERSFRRWPEYTLNGEKAAPSISIQDNDIITAQATALPTLAELLGLDDTASESYTVIFNDVPCKIPIRRYTLGVNGKPAQPSDIPKSGSLIEYSFHEIIPIVGDVLLAAEFDVRTLPTSAKIEVLVNDLPAEYTAFVKNGDKINIKVTNK